MGKGRARHFDPFYKNNKNIYVPKEARPIIHQQMMPRVEATRDIKITDKTISFVADALDCCIEKVVKEYVPYFQNEGYQVTVTLQKGIDEIIKLIPRWVVLIRVGSGKEFNQELGLPNASKVIQHLRRLGIRVVYYIDDFLVAANGNAPVAIASLCDAVIVATSELKDFFRNITNFKPPIIHVPTHIDIPIFDIVPPLDYIKNIPRYKVLMTSSGRVGATGLFEICEKANDMPEFQDIQIVVNSGGVAQMRTIINSFRHLHKTYVDSIPLDQYYGLCKSVDLIINPASDKDLDYLIPTQYQTTWLNSKSALKYTMAGGARIPIISSPMRSYLEAIKDGETGFIARTPDEFIEKILYLKNNPTKAAHIGIAARQDVMANYDVRKRYPLYRDAIIGEIQTEEIKASIAPTIQVGASISKRLFIPSIDGGPGSFYANMRKYLPIISEGKWTVTNNIKIADVAIALAFLNAAQIFEERESRGLKYLYRLDGLPMNFDGTLNPDHLKIMQELFRYASVPVWQSKHCRDMWNDKDLVPADINCTGTIIPNGVDTSIFKPNNSLDIKSINKTKLLNVTWSTFVHKRIDLLTSVVDTANKLESNLHFYMLGNYVSTDIEANGDFWKDKTNVTYLGQITDRNRDSLIRLADIYTSVNGLIFTSNQEGSPNTALEAIACGIPILYNKEANIIPEICEKNCIGFFTPEDFINNYKSINEIDKNILINIANTYSVQIMVQKYLEVINGIN